MYINYLEKLEFYKITERVGHFCATNQGKDLASKLIPSNQISEVQKLLQETRRGCEFVLS